MGAAKRFSRRFAASVTGFARRYREDLFFRTTVAVVLLQTGFALFLLALVAIGGTILYQQILEAVSDALADALSSGASPDGGFMLAQNLEYARATTIVVVATLILIGTAIFGYLIAHLALGPTRNALVSQKQFVSNVAHELRTPLSIIKTNAEVALFTEKEGTAARRMLEGTVEELDRISDIINNLLSLSAVVRPERMRFAAVDLEEIANRAVGALADLAYRRTVDVKIDAEPAPRVWGNATALEQIAMNLVKNAIVYSREAGPAVRVRIAPTHDNHVELSVEDEGAGISDKDLPRVLEPFFRGDPSRTRRSSGSGLGLAIVNELLKLHSGKMRIKSTLGRGTKVTVSLPKAPDEDGVPAKESSGEVSIDFSHPEA